MAEAIAKEQADVMDRVPTPEASRFNGRKRQPIGNAFAVDYERRFISFAYSRDRLWTGSCSILHADSFFDGFLDPGDGVGAVFLAAFRREQESDQETVGEELKRGPGVRKHSD